MNTEPLNQEAVAVVIPTFNEGGNIGRLLAAILQLDSVSLIVVVDDDSGDTTVKEVETIQASDRRVVLIKRKGTRSFAQSYRDGFRHALQQGVWSVIQMDADGSHRVEDLHLIIQALKRCDWVVGSRYVARGQIEGWSYRRKLISRFGNFYARWMLRLFLRDLTSGFNGWRATVVEDILKHPIPFEGYGFQIWLKYMAFQKGYSFTEAPIVFRDRNIGISKFHRGILWESFLEVLRMRQKGLGAAFAKDTRRE